MNGLGLPLNHIYFMSHIDHPSDHDTETKNGEDHQRDPHHINPSGYRF